MKIGDLTIIDLFPELDTVFVNLQKNINELSKNTAIFIKDLGLYFKEMACKHEHMVFRNGWLVTTFVWENSEIANISNSEIENDIYNEIFRKFFFAKNFKNLELMIAHWNKNKLFVKRMKIFDDSLYLLQQFHKYERINIFTILLPVLISQLDGISYDLVSQLGYKIEGKFIKNKEGEKISRWELFSNLKQHEWLEVNTYKMISDVLFKSSKPGVPIDVNNDFLKEFNIEGVYDNYNRNKIMHGENIEYGNINNVLRGSVKNFV